MKDELIPLIDLKRQHASMQDEIDEALRRVFESGRFIGGVETPAFEQEFAAYCGLKHGVAVGSGTAALNLAIKALGIGAGDEVITVAFTLSATLDAISDAGARPVLVDVDSYHYTMDLAQAAAAVTPRTKAILPVHIYGHPADMDPLLDLARQHNLAVIGDACEAHGTEYNGKPVASFGTVACFSFYPTKNLNAVGDAGGVFTDDHALAERVRMLRQHGWDSRFHSAVISLNSRADEIQAAVLRAKLKHLDVWNARRREIAVYFDEALAGTPVKPSPRAEWATPSYYLYVVTTPDRQAFRRILGEHGVGSDVHWPEAPHVQPAYAHLGYSRGSLPVTERLCDEVVTIPLFPEMTDAEIARVSKALHKASRAVSAPAV